MVRCDCYTHDQYLDRINKIILLILKIVSILSNQSSARACFKTLSTLNPSSRIATSPGADAPNRSRHITSPDGPTYRSQPCLTPASIARRAVIAFGNTSSRYSCDCSSNNSTQGIDTTRVGTPSASSLDRKSVV